MADEKNGSAGGGEVKKPSLLSQALPYLFTAAILVWVFTGLKSNVINEPHELTRGEWTALDHHGIKPESIKVKSASGKEYCRFQEGKPVGQGCPRGGDFRVRPGTGERPASIQRTAGSRIPQGEQVLVSYVKDVRFQDLWAIVAAADLSFFIPLMVLHSLVFFMGDVFSFGIAYRWFNDGKLKLSEIMEVRGAPYIVQIGIPTLAEVLFPLYMWRVKRVPATETVSSNIWAMLMDIGALFTALTPAVVYNLYIDNVIPAIGGGWLVVCIFFWLLFFSNLVFWHSPLQHRAREWIARGKEKSDKTSGVREGLGGALQLLRTFSYARRHHYLRAYLARLMILASALVSNYAALLAVGVQPEPTLAVIGVPIVVLSVFLPIGVGGYGGPQLIAWFIFVKLGNAGTADQIIAYSLLWSTAFLAGRAVIGMVFMPGFWKKCFSARVTAP